MKTQTKNFMFCAVVALSITLSCSKEQATDLQQPVNFIQISTDIENEMDEKVGADKAVEMMKQLQNPSRFAITYEGQLCPGVVNYGAASYRGHANLANADFWYFTGNAGDIISIDVDRVSCEMDPVFLLYSGSGDTTSLTLLTGADDDDLPACTPACFSFADPSITGYALPTSGDFTIAVWDYIGGACTSGLQSYSIVMTGNFCTIIIDGCDTGVTNQTLPDGTTMQDAIDACAAGATNHGDFVSCVAHLTNDWKAAGLISGRDKGRIQRCAAQSSIP